MSETQVNERAVVQAQNDDFMPMELSAMSERLSYVEKFCKEILKKDQDFGVIPGTSKPTIYKPGAEKLAFAFSLEARYTIESRIEEPFRDWEYEFTKRGSSEIIKQKARGYFKFTVLCELYNRSTGERWGSQLADCDSLERGRETSPSNTIMKMAEKRAYVGAVLNSTFTSDRFTQDVEDYKGNQAPSQSGNNQSGVDEGFASKYGSADKPNFCGFCEKFHVVAGDIITKTGKKSTNSKESYGAVVCRDKSSKVNEHGRTEEEQKKRDAAIKRSGGASESRIRELEELWIKSGATDNDVDEARRQKTGKSNFDDMNNAQRINYNEFLEELGLEA